MITNLAQLPFLTKVIAILSILLLISVGLNTYQLYHMGKVAGRAENEAQIKLLEATNLGLEKTVAVNSAIADLAIEDNTKLVEDLKGIAESARTSKIVYKQAVSATPLPINCAPGGVRVEKVNEMLGATK